MTGTKRTEPTLGTIAAQATDMGLKIGEMVAATNYVVGTRVAMMGAAMTNPVGGDYRELGRMVPEKAAALTDAGAAFLGSFGAIQRDMMAHVGDMTSLMMGGMASPTKLARVAHGITARGARALLWPMAAGAATMAPVHGTVTANARRLSGG